jgi:FkbM family methyltransferase
MITARLNRFIRKPWKEKTSTAQFFLRQALARLPYLSVPVRLKISKEEELRFRWSYVAPFHDPTKRFFDYWGHDLAELRVLWKILEPGMFFLDIGAYHGIYSLVALKRLNGSGQIVAFEPSPNARRRLTLHLRRNGGRAAKIEPYAMSSGSSESTFFQVVSGDTTRNGLRPPSSEDVVAPLTIQTVSLDQYVAEARLPRVDVIKLDIEGGERDALHGATKVLDEFRPVIICEVFDAAAQAWGYHARETVSLLKAHGYEWFEFRPDGSLAAHEIRDRYPEVQNYLAVPREKCQRCLAQVTQ